MVASGRRLRLLLRLLLCAVLAAAAAAVVQAQRGPPHRQLVSDGVAISARDYAFVVNIYRLRKSSFAYDKFVSQCSGSLVSPGVVMTAAHCFEDDAYIDPTHFRVLFGRDEAAKEFEYWEGREATAAVARVEIAPGFSYDRGAAVHDVALLFLSECADRAAHPPIKIVHCGAAANDGNITNAALAASECQEALNTFGQVQFIGYGNTESACFGGKSTSAAESLSNALESTATDGGGAPGESLGSATGSAWTDAAAFLSEQRRNLRRSSFPLQRMTYNTTLCSAENHHQRTCGDHLRQQEGAEGSGAGNFSSFPDLFDDRDRALSPSSECFCMRQRGVATCIGDSGGPLFVKIDAGRLPASTPAAMAAAAGWEEEDDDGEVSPFAFRTTLGGQDAEPTTGASAKGSERQGQPEAFQFLQIGVLSSGSIDYTDYKDFSLSLERPLLQRGSDGKVYSTDFVDQASGVSLVAYTKWLREQLFQDPCTQPLASHAELHQRRDPNDSPFVDLRALRVANADGSYKD